MKTEVDILEIGGERIGLQERRDIELELTRSYSGLHVRLPATVIRGVRPGPAIFVTAALHGDEVNGTGIVRALILDENLNLASGSLVLIPVVNILGFERHSRYLPDRRDLNRCFPGNREGTACSRFAHVIFREIITRCNFGIDLHTAAVRRANFSNVRADLDNPAVRRLAKSFGCEVIVSGKGPQGSLRRAACKAGLPTICLEAGGVWKVEPSVVKLGARGVLNVLASLGMIEGQPEMPPFQVLVKRTKWIRADAGGMLRFHVAPGDTVRSGQPIATNTNLLGVEQNMLTSPGNGIVLGMITLPFVTPGDPVCQLGLLGKEITTIERIRQAGAAEGLDQRLREDLATDLVITDPPRSRGTE